MILHPGILSLLIGSIIVTLMILYSSLLGLKIIRRWDINSSTQEQLSLERKTYLISTIMNYVFGFEILSSFLFIYTVDDIYRIFVGAMCATGSLNANPIGWNVLYTKIIIFFLSAFWIVFNYIDQRAEDYPLVRFKYKMIFFIMPIIIIDSYLQFKYFSGLEPDIITSCCGALFSEDSAGFASSLSGLPVKPMILIFYSTIFIFLSTAIFSLLHKNRFLKYAITILSLIVFITSILSIISFISLYFYEIPTHHCPFDILQKGYKFVGYPLYFALFSGVFFSMVIGITEPFKKILSLTQIITEAHRKWLILSIFLLAVFTIISSWPIIFSSFTLKEYF